MQYSCQRLAILALIIIATQIPQSVWAKEAPKLNSAIKATKAISNPKSIKVVRPKINDAIKPPKPDLIVARITSSKDKPVLDEEITLTVYVKNNGLTTAGPSGVRVQVGGESHPPVISVPSLAIGQEFSYTKKVTFTRATNYYVTATADANNAVVELSENNNVMRKTLRVTPVLPDLWAGQAMKSRIGCGNRSKPCDKLHFMVANFGHAPLAESYSAPSSNFVILRYFVNGQQVRQEILKDTVSPDLFQATRGGLRQGRFPVEFDCLSHPSGTYEFKAILDPNHVVEESNESNNTLIYNMTCP